MPIQDCPAEAPAAELAWMGGLGSAGECVHVWYGAAQPVCSLQQKTQGRDSGPSQQVLASGALASRSHLMQHHLLVLVSS